MKSITWIAIIVGIASSLLGSVFFQFFTATGNSSHQLELEKKCEEIAFEGFKVQIKYSEINFDTMPQEDANKLQYLDNLWMKECVPYLSDEKILEITKNVERQYYAGE